AAGDQVSPNNVTDSIGGCIYVFQDMRNGVDWDIYAHHLDMNGNPPNGIFEENNALESKVFPNPFSSSAVIEINFPGKMGNIIFSVYDLLGNKVLCQTVNSKQQTVNMSGAKSGIYTYKIFSGTSAVASGKLMVE
ncbi:MAG: T9SS type A sorting domain-containing protein, partial [Bacteroidetes bacterium]|nr:T9SS type A sorting domain-containing protein [Bacteroidota bacterium]